MALQVWLPLNGTLENKGLSNVKMVSTNAPTYTDNGKIGKAIVFLNDINTTIRDSNVCQDLKYTDNFSYCFWLKNASIGSAAASYLFTVGRADAGSYGYGVAISSATQIIFKFGSHTATKNIVNGEWNFIVFTKSGTTLTYYINGVVSTATFSGTLPSYIPSEYRGLGIGCFHYYSGNIYPCNATINDFRIYDHALSPKEVKEISKGLILHYKLDGNDIGITIPRNGGLIPDGVELYDYLAGNSYAWINTNYYVDLNKNLLITTESMKTVAGRSIILGNYNGNLNLSLEWNASNLGRVYLSGDKLLVSIGLNTKLTLVINWNASTSTLSGTQNNNTFTGSGSKSISSNPLRIFADTRTDSSEFSTLVRIYRVSITEEGVLVRNFIPCTYLGEPGMWDTVENKFYRNQGTGLFTLGNKITLKEYEYLLSSGTQWIDTGIYGTLNTKVILEFKIPGASSTTNAGYYFGCRDGLNSKAFIIGTSDGTNTTSAKYFAQFDSVTSNILSSFSLDFNKHIIELSKYGFYIDNTLYRTYASSQTFQTSHTLPIFGYYSIDTNQHTVKTGILTVYSIKVLENDLLVRDFIPVSYNGTPGLWDKVEWRFYANAGSGSFTLGPEKTVQQDAPIFYDSSGYCNHGSITGTLTTNSDSPRYTQGTVFNGSNSVIKGTLQLSNDYKYTASFWVKPTSFGLTRWIFAVASGSNHLFGCYLNGDINTLVGGVVGSSVTTWSAGLLANTLYHIAITSDGTNVKVYKNGELLGTNTKNGTTTGTTFWIGLRPGAAGMYNYHGILSDFRIYCTALSEDDIKELYNTSAFVTNNGVFAEYELYEDNLSDVKKRGLLETANFYENGAESGYALDTDKTRVASNYIISEDFIEI